MKESELEERLRELGKEYPEVQSEVKHYLDIGWKPSEAFSRLLDWVDRGIISPQSNTGKDLRRLSIELGIYEQGEWDFSTHKNYAFQLDGEKYRHNKQISKVIEGDER